MISLARAWRLALDMLFPPLCYACRAPLGTDEKGLSICRACRNAANPHSSLACPVCRARVPGNIPACHPHAGYLLLSAAPYENPIVRNLISTLKYGRLESAVRPITSLLLSPLADALTTHCGLAADYVLVPVPLTKRKERSRGFNQSALLARALASLLVTRGVRAEVAPLLIRTRNTKSQTTLEDRRGRAANVKDCFTLNQNLKFEIKNSHIIIVDDVFTSGATMHEAARVLKNAGAHHILALTLARA